MGIQNIWWKELKYLYQSGFCFLFLLMKNNLSSTHKFFPNTVKKKKPNLKQSQLSVSYFNLCDCKVVGHNVLVQLLKKLCLYFQIVTVRSSLN